VVSEGAEKSGKVEDVGVEGDGWSVANGVEEGRGPLSARSTASADCGGTECLEMGAVLDAWIPSSKQQHSRQPKRCWSCSGCGTVFPDTVYGSGSICVPAVE
jgi:hypothetical protein